MHSTLRKSLGTVVVREGGKDREEGKERKGGKVREGRKGGARRGR